REQQASLSLQVRSELDLSRSEFATRYHIPINTLRNWDVGRDKPDAVAVALLKTIAALPDQVAKALSDEDSTTEVDWL
ncbi:MAG: helix-turn-helix domain-containing protein, partial [Hyphomicrobiaceae bacterium]